MTRRELFQRLSAGLAAVSAVSLLPHRAKAARGGLNILPPELKIMSSTDRGDRCEFISNYRPELGSEVSFVYEGRTIFSGTVTETIQAGSATKVMAEDIAATTSRTASMHLLSWSALSR